jgi:hypothetical protein
MPSASRRFLFLLLLAGCGAPSREPAPRNTQAGSPRAWRGPDRPLEPVSESGTALLRAWARADSGEVEAEPARVSQAESAPIATEGPDGRGSAAPGVALSPPAGEPAPIPPEPIPTPPEEEGLPAIATPAPVETRAPPEAPPPVDPERRVDRRASIVLMWYFQRDDDPDSLGRSELEEAFSQYDWNKNGVVIELEFDATTGSSAEYGREPQGEALELLGDVEPLEALLAAVDSDADGALSLNELLAFHDTRFAQSGH